jgi:hypothetical protein
MPQTTETGEWVEWALDIIGPPPEQREAVRRDVTSFIETLPHTVPYVLRKARGVPTKQLQSYRKRLTTMRRACDDGAPASEEFVQALEGEIDLVQELLRGRHGHRPRDRIAEWAVAYAAKLLAPERRKLTNGGPWHDLAMLFYEAATGKADRDHVLNYMREMKSHGKIFRLHLRRSAPTAR